MRLLIPSLIFLCGLVIYGGVVYVWPRWVKHEQSRQDQERRRMDAAMRLTDFPQQRAANFNIRAAGVSSSRKQVQAVLHHQCKGEKSCL